MTNRKKMRLYWDSTNFICLVNEDEAERADHCQRILDDAEDGKVEIFTSALTIAEVVRPRDRNPSPEEEAAIRGFYE